MQIFAKIKISKYAHIEIETIIYFFSKITIIWKKEKETESQHSFSNKKQL